MPTIAPTQEDLNAEAAVLFAILYRPETIAEVAKALTQRDFASEAHRAILGAAMALHEASSPLDIVTVGGRLGERDQLEAAGGMDYLEGLLGYSEVISGIENLRYYVRIVKEKSLLRQLASLCQRMHLRCAGDSSFAELYAAVYRQLLELGEASKDLSRPTFVAAPDLVKTSLRKHAERLKSGVVLSTGLAKLDEATRGIHPKELWVIGGRSSMGKSSLMTSMALSLARSGTVLVFSLEMPGEDIADRMLCNLSGMQMSEICDLRVDDRAVRVRDAIYRVPSTIQDQ
jgi:replicative DNA helicase